MAAPAAKTNGKGVDGGGAQAFPSSSSTGGGGATPAGAATSGSFPPLPAAYSNSEITEESSVASSIRGSRRFETRRRHDWLVLQANVCGNFADPRLGAKLFLLMLLRKLRESNVRQLRCREIEEGMGLLYRALDLESQVGMCS